MTKNLELNIPEFKDKFKADPRNMLYQERKCNTGFENLMQNLALEFKQLKFQFRLKLAKRVSKL